MLYTMHHGKIHRATVTQANLEYMGSITIDSELLQVSIPAVHKFQHNQYQT